MRTVKTLIAILALLVTMLVCGYLLYTFFFIDYLPVWIRYTIQGLCAVAIIAAIALCATYIKSVETQARREKYAGKSSRVSTK